MTKDELYAKIVSVLHETFGIDESKIRPDSQLNADLDIDSIDAIDLIVQMKSVIGTRPAPEAFKGVRTVQDVVDVLYNLVHPNG